MAAAPGAPFAPKFSERVKGPFLVAAALMFVLVILSVVTKSATVTLFLLLLSGAAVNSRWADMTGRLLKPMTKFANILAGLW